MACSILGCHHSHLWLVRISDWVSQCMIISVLPESYWPIRKTFEKKICLLLVPNLSVFPPSLFPPFIFFISFLCFLSPFLPSFTLFFPSHPPASFSPLPHFPISIPYFPLFCWLYERKQATQKLYKYQLPSYPHKGKQSYLKLMLKVTELRDGKNVGLWCHPWDTA